MNHHKDFKKRALLNNIKVFHNRVRLRFSDHYMNPSDFESTLQVTA